MWIGDSVKRDITVTILWDDNDGQLSLRDVRNECIKSLTKDGYRVVNDGNDDSADVV